MADDDLLNWWFRAPRGGVASGGSALPPAMPGQTPRMPPPVSSPLSTVTGTPAFQLGYPLIAGLVSGLFPNRGGRAIAGLSAGLNTANYYNQLQRQEQELAKQEEEKRLLGDKLGSYLGANKLVPPAPFEGQPTEGPANQVPVVPDSPRKALAQALIEANQPAAALRFMEPDKERPPLNVGPGHTIVDPETYEPRYTAPPAPREPPAPPPPFGSPETGFYERPVPGTEGPIRQLVPPVPRTAPPARELTDLEKRDIESRITSRGSENAERAARMRRLEDAAKVAKDPAANQEKLTTMYNTLQRDFEYTSEYLNDPGRAATIRNVQNNILQRLDAIGRSVAPTQQPGGGGAPAPAQAGPPPPTVGAVIKGYRFKGGDPANKANWEKVK